MKGYKPSCRGREALARMEGWFQMTMERFQAETGKRLEDARVRRVLWGVCLAAGGFLAARAVVFGRCGPFGVAFLAACPWEGALFAAVGAALGYLLPGDVLVPMHCVGALLACLAIRWALRALRQWRNPCAFAAFLAGISMLAMGLCVAFVNGSTPQGTAYFLAEGLLSGAWGYFYARTRGLLGRLLRGKWELLPADLASAAFAAGPVLLALSTVKIGPVGLGGAFAVFLVLFATKYGGMSGGAVAGIAAGACFAFSGTGLSSVLGAYGIGGLLGGLFMPLGKLWGACAFVLTSALASLPGGVTGARLETLWEVAAAAVVFLLLPERVETRGLFGKILKPLLREGTAEPPRAGDLRKQVVLRLDHAAEAMEEVAKTVQQVGEKLEKARLPEGPAERRGREAAKQARGRLVQQFSTVGTVLEELAGDFERRDSEDTAAEQGVREVFYTFALEPLDVRCGVDRFGRMTVEALVVRGDGATVNKAELAKEIGKACGRTFGLPSFSRTAMSWRLVFCERKGCRVCLGVARHNCYNGALCGDSTRCLEDGSGHYLAILSDGMGSGGRAAVDGVMVSDLLARLIDAGIGFSSALQIVNAAMGVKSGDESVATVDLLCLDLYTCAAEFYKAGGALSLIKCGDTVGPVDAPGLPIGILDQAAFHRSRVQLSPGDWVLLLSDGALCEGTAWIASLLQDANDATSPQELAEAVVAGAVARRSDGHDDDVTALAVHLAPL